MTMKLLLVKPSLDTYPHKPINLALLSAIAKRRGWETCLFDAGAADAGVMADPPEQAGRRVPPNGKPGNRGERLGSAVRALLREFPPDLVAMTVISDNRFTAAAITGAIRDADPTVPVLWGGVEPTISPERALREYKADLVCRGEGLGAFDDVLQACQENRDFRSIPNIWSRGDGGIVKNPVRPLVRDLDSLPFLDLGIYPAFSRQGRTPGENYRNADHMITWGCPNSCSYCINDFYHALYGPGYFIRQYSVGRIIDELQWLKEQFGITYLNFHDEDFLLKSEEYLELLSLAYRKQVDIPFSIMASPGSATERKAGLLKKMHCSTVAFGIETGDMAIRTGILRRNDSREDIIRSVTLFSRTGIRTSSFNMLALPFYSREAYEKTIELNRTAGVFAPYAGFFYPYEGTIARKIATEEGFFDPENPDTAVNSLARPALHFPCLSREELVGMREVFPLYCRLPEGFFRYIRRAEMPDRTGIRLRELLHRIAAEGYPAGPGSRETRRDETIYRHQLDAVQNEKNPELY